MNSDFRYLVMYALLSLAVVGTASAANAQGSDSPSSTAPDNSGGGFVISIIGGRGSDSPIRFRDQFGQTVYTAMRHPALFELEISKTLMRSKGERFYNEFFVASQPVISAAGNIRYNGNACFTANCKPLNLDLERYTTYGFGLMPFGVRTTGILSRDVRVGVSVGAGAVYFSKAVPYAEATHFNFHFMARPMLGLRLGNSGRVWTGYEFVHVSNGGTGKFNPGINAGLFMLGFERVTN
jgi:hypothetical protein